MLALMLAAIVGQSSPQSELKFTDGSIVRCTLTQKSVKVETAYGPLTIPVADIYLIEFGVHVTKEERATIDQALKDLASDKWPKREKAEAVLVGLGEKAYLFLKSGEDLEQAKRIAAVKSRIQSRCTRLRNTFDDRIVTKHFEIVGLITDGISVSSKHFGPLRIGAGSLVSLTVDGVHDVAFTVKADGEWLDTGIRIVPNASVSLDAFGQVDLWPQEMGSYTTKPDGYKQAGKGSMHNAGALVGRIGDGPSFLIGSSYRGRLSAGRLFVRIVPSPWNADSRGEYRVRVRTDFTSD